MGKNKPQPYQLFVRDEFNKMKRAGQDVLFNSLFQALDPKWKSLSQEERQWYKDRATNGGHGPPRPPPQQQHSPPNSQPPNQEAKPSTSNFSFRGENNGTGQADKEDIDVKPMVKEERGLKRELELDISGGFRQEEQEYEQANKKKKNMQGHGVPNWKNIKNSPQPDADRYFDHHLVKLREQCESIVATQQHRLMSLPLHTISCNVLCKYKKDGTEVKYVPIEIGINTYSIGSGQLKSPYHVLINSGAPPRNYWGDTHDHLTSTHKIKVTQDGVYPPEARNDYKSIYKEMIRYVKDGERVVLVADNYDLEQVRKSIEWIYEKAAALYDEDSAGPAKPSTWTVLPLVDFVTSLYNFVYVKKLHYPLPKFTLSYYLKVRLETSIWDYDVGLMCPYHKKDDHVTKWCARSCAIRVINALQMTFEEIFRNYKTAEEAETKSKQAQPNGPTNQQDDQPPTNKAPRTPAQQLQQPLHMPEEKEPPPVFEEMARREEIRRRQEEALRNPPPPPGDYEYNIQLRASQDENQPKAIEAAPKQHVINSLDPRLRRNVN